MADRALGLIEVKGMLGAVLAADAALKAANVELLGNQRIRGGLTTVQLLGDVAAVYAAVEAGVDEVKNTNSFIASHVIPRLDEQVEHMLMKKYQKEERSDQSDQEKNNEELSADSIEPSKAKTQWTVKPETLETLEGERYETPEERIQKTLEEQETDKKSGRTILERAELERMKVVDLRSLAYKQNITNLTKKEIKYANKELLIRALLEKGVNGE